MLYHRNFVQFFTADVSSPNITHDIQPYNIAQSWTRAGYTSKEHSLPFATLTHSISGHNNAWE